MKVGEWSCVPSLLFTWGQTMVEVMKIMATSFKRSHALLHSVPPISGNYQPTPLPETPRHSQASLGQSLVGSFLLSPGSWCTQVSVCALQESVSPVLCKFWQLCGGLMATSSQRAYAIPRSTAPRAQPTADPHLPRGNPNTLCFSPYGVSVLVCTRYV